MSIRPAVVAGQFYPREPEELSRLVQQYLDDATCTSVKPKAIIAPHAGFVYSGPIAGSAYRALDKAGDISTRVILLGPSHHVAFHGVAAPESTGFQTPLGNIPIDQTAIAKISALASFQINSRIHEYEHSLEVQLPFLQHMLGDFQLIPLIVGEIQPVKLAEILDRLWGGDETLIVVSSDLSHYHPYAEAMQLDSATSQQIEALNPVLLGHQACGCRPVNGLLVAAKQRGLAAVTLDLRNSGDTAGDRERVVGYGAYAFH